MDDVRLEARIVGRVQGVSYRHYTLRQARALGLSGFVRNLPDGSVELVAEGSRRRLEELLAWCQRGPALAVVESIDTHWGTPAGEFHEFEIRH